jgi:hypothetical protein
MSKRLRIPYRTWQLHANLALVLALLAWMGAANQVRGQDYIEPEKPIKDLLPKAPATYEVGPITSDDLKYVPEVQLHASLGTKPEAFTSTVIMLARIVHINMIRQDGFLKARRPNAPIWRVCPLSWATPAAPTWIAAHNSPWPPGRSAWHC